RYKRKGHSSLGIDPKKQQIVWEGAPEKKPSHKKPERYYSRSAVQMLRIRAEHVACSKDTTNAASAGFIPVMDYDPDTSSTSAARTSWVNPLGIYDDSTSMWLQGKGGPEDKTSPAAPRDTELLGKVEDYNRRIRENPGDIQTWMEFVSFQDELLAQPSMYSTCEGEVDSYRMSLKLLLEKKLSILDRAIEGNPGSTELKLARLRLCEEFWEAPALLKEWQKLVFLHPNDPQLWQKYLLFSQSHFSTFSVSKVIAVYGKCLSTLAAVQDGSMLSHPVVPGTERSMCANIENPSGDEIPPKESSVCTHFIWVVQCIGTQRKKQLKSQGKRSRRLAKSLLKEPWNRNSLALWKEYALLEWLLGNAEEARKVFDATIGLAGGKGLKDQELCNLCLLYAELEGGITDPSEGGGGSRAVHILASLAESSPYKPYIGPAQAINILKARKTYERTLQDSLNLPPSASLVTLTGCYALFQYLTVGMEAAATVFRQVTGSLSPPAAGCGKWQDSYSPLQTVKLMQINLFRHHVKVSVYPRAPLRDALLDALRLYPDNITLWNSYIQTESRSHNISKARRFIDGVRRTSDALEPYLFAIRAEEDRKKLLESVQRVDMGEVHTVFPETGLSNRIKALFEHCVGTERGSRCVLLWRMYLHF
ncbi:hypothetical protein AB205_0077810, partial [Aquarana catesbeiana]